MQADYLFRSIFRDCWVAIFAGEHIQYSIITVTLGTVWSVALQKVTFEHTDRCRQQSVSGLVLVEIQVIIHASLVSSCESRLECFWRPVVSAI